MGGRLALEAALARPELVTSLHLISTHPGGLTSQEIAAREVWNSVWAERILTLPWQDLLEMWNSQEIFAHGSASPTPGAEFRTPIPRETVLGSPSSQPDTRPWTWTPLTEGDSTLRQRLAMALKKWSVTQQTFLDAATLWPASVRWYYGDLDAKYRDLYSGPLFQTARLKSANLDFRKIAIPGAGHRIPLDQPKALSDHILTQIKEQT